jgi:hypothetical protein
MLVVRELAQGEEDLPMPMLLEDLAEETSASNRRTADRLDEEARQLEELQATLAAREELRQRAIESAQQATDQVLSRLPQAEGVWRSALVGLRNRTFKDSEERILRQVLAVFESGQRLIPPSRALWKVAETVGASPERLEELDEAEGRFEALAAEVAAALEHRTQGWQPADPERLAQGLQLAREGKTIKSEEARARFRRPQS